MRALACASKSRPGAPVFVKVSDTVRASKGNDRKGSIRNISFENITATDYFSDIVNRGMPCVIWGNPDTPVQGLSFHNVTMITKGGHAVVDAEVEPEENDELIPMQMGTIPAYAWYIRHVEDVTFRDCRFGCEKPEGRPAFAIDDSAGVLLHHTSIPVGTESSSRICVRNDAADFMIRGCPGLSDLKATVRNQSF